MKEAPNKIELTGLPQRCSACFGQDSKRRHIDLDAACDRGYGNEETVKIAYDDLILCENCVKEAAELIDMTDSEDLKARLLSLEDELDRERKARRQAQRYATAMEGALEERPEKVKIDHRKLPRKELVDA